MKPDQREKLVNDWEKLNDFLRQCSEEEASELLEHEKRRKKPRASIARRIYHRLSKCRRERERLELLT